MSFVHDLLSGLEGVVQELEKEGAAEAAVIKNEVAQLRPLVEADIAQAEGFAKDLVKRRFSPPETAESVQQ